MYYDISKYPLGVFIRQLLVSFALSQSSILYISDRAGIKNLGKKGFYRMRVSENYVYAHATINSFGNHMGIAIYICSCYIRSDQKFALQKTAKIVFALNVILEQNNLISLCTLFPFSVSDTIYI